MKVPIFLFINQNRQVRMTKKDPAAYPNELGINLILEVPDAFFRRPNPRATVTIPEDILVNPDPKVAVQVIAPQIAESLRLEVKTVEDGLLTLLASKTEQ
jgi:hypothetical protein